MAPSHKPLWARLLDDRTSQSWLKEHAKEFPANSFLPDDVAFKDKASAQQKFLAELITELLPSLKGDDQKVAKLYLRTHPARIATAMGWPRKDVYLAIRRLKRAALRAWQKRRGEQVLARVDQLDLDAPPDLVALRSIKFELHGVEKRAYLVSRDGHDVWVDEAGGVFAEDVQEILHDLPEHAAAFEVVDVETGG